MLRSYNLNSQRFFYYDLENKTIARFPTKSNLLPVGSDNSLYFGKVDNKEITNIICSLWEIDSLNNFTNKEYEMKCGMDIVKVVCNVNKQKQIQIKICKDGTMYKLFEEFSFEIMENINYLEMLIVVDFKHLEIRFKDPQNLYL